MAITNLRELFEAGALPILEQFVRGTTRIADATQLLTSRILQPFSIGAETIARAVLLTQRAAVPARILQAGGKVREDTVPRIPGLITPGEFGHTGLAKISTVDSTGTPVFSTHVPFNIHEDKILKLEEVRERLLQAIENATDRETEEWYKAELARVNDAISFYLITGNVAAEPQMLSVFQGE